jgi:hypothetical protein
MDSLATSKSRTASNSHREASFLRAHPATASDGARPSSGAAMLVDCAALGFSMPTGQSYLAAPEDGRAPFLLISISSLARAFVSSHSLCSHN